ncbi:MAG: hypothetical protein ABIS14_04310 [Sphingomonas sp.]
MFSIGQRETGASAGFLSTLIGSAAIFFIQACVPPKAVAQPREPTFFVISRNITSEMLIQLNSLAGAGSDTSVNVLSLYRKPVKSGLLVTWHIDCTSRTMNLVRGNAFSPSGSAGDQTLNSEIVSENTTTATHAIYKLACVGEAKLPKDRVYYDELPAMVRRFWQQ